MSSFCQQPCSDYYCSYVYMSLCTPHVHMETEFYTGESKTPSVKHWGVNIMIWGYFGWYASCRLGHHIIRIAMRPDLNLTQLLWEKLDRRVWEHCTRCVRPLGSAAEGLGGDFTWIPAKSISRMLSVVSMQSLCRGLRKLPLHCWICVGLQLHNQR